MSLHRPVRRAVPAVCALRSLAGRHRGGGHRPGLQSESFGPALVGLDTHLAGTPVASALVATSGFTATSTGYAGTSDGWTDLADNRMDWTYPHAGPGNIVQTGRLPVGVEQATFALSFGASTTEALAIRHCQPDERLSRGQRRVPAGVEGLPHHPQARSARAQRRPAHPVQRVPDDRARTRGQDLPWRIHRLAHSAVGTAGQRRRRWRRRRRISLRVGPRPLPPGDQPAGGRRHRRREPGGDLAVRPGSNSRTGTSHRTHTWTAAPTRTTYNSMRPPSPSCWRGRSAAPSGVVLPGPHQEGRRLPGRRRATHASGALGDRGRLLPVDDGLADRRTHRRGRHRPQQRRRGGVGDLPGHRRLLAAPDREVDVHHHRPGRRRPLLHPHRGRRRPERRRHPRVLRRRRRTSGAQHPRRRLPRAGPARASRHPTTATCPARWPRPTPRWPRTPRPAGCGTATPTTATARRPTAHPGTARASAGSGRCSPASAASTRSPTAATRCPTCRPCTTPPTTAT